MCGVCQANPRTSFLSHPPPAAPARSTMIPQPQSPPRRPAFLRFAPDALPTAELLAEPATPPMSALPPLPVPAAPRACRKPAATPTPVSPVGLADGAFDPPPVARRLDFDDIPPRPPAGDAPAAAAKTAYIRELKSMANLKM